MSACSICLDPIDDSTAHVKCTRALFGTRTLPHIELEIAKLHTAGLAMLGSTSISGAQRKISVKLSSDRKTLQVAVAGGRFILKPQAHAFLHLPENEHVSMRLAALAGCPVPPCGLIRLADDSLAYVIGRFDRDADGRKRLQEDFCQAGLKLRAEKYAASAEFCARLTARFATEPGVAALDLFRRFVVSWWLGNGDLHLKNLSFGTDEAGRRVLTPVYDMLNTRLLIEGDELALPVGGRDRNLTRGHWLAFAAYAGLPERAAERVLARLVDRREAACELVARSYLPAEQRADYAALLIERSAVLAAG